MLNLGLRKGKTSIGGGLARGAQACGGKGRVRFFNHFAGVPHVLQAEVKAFVRDCGTRHDMAERGIISPALRIGHFPGGRLDGHPSKAGKVSCLI